MTDAPATPTPPAGDPNATTIRVMGQYVKDLSFENPGAPDTLRQPSQPNIRMSVDLGARALGDDTYEVQLVMGAHAGEQDNPVFIVELTYAGLFQIKNIDERARDAFLLIECPRILFPFARRIISDATRDGGFMPLMIEPIDFAALYRQRALQAQQQGQGTEEPPVGNA